MADPKIEAARPLSPHLQIYKPMLTMMMSIVHRMTGAVLYLGTLLLAWWLIAAATNEAYFAFVDGLFGSFLGRLVLFGYTWALIHHALGGIRHFIWDTGRGFGPESREWLARLSIVGSVALTVLVWVIGYAVR
ncbi:MAG: succinate dehydrogenase, cytochrome b556 subunit [Hyphomicrobiales bacterium]|nr:MAG: succinate dehydrogenase, cytochrome b556 subunit [Hyphomicrobiales bacterium]